MGRSAGLGRASLTGAAPDHTEESEGARSPRASAQVPAPAIIAPLSGLWSEPCAQLEHERHPITER